MYICVLEIGRKKEEKKSKARVRASLDSHSTERSAEQTRHQQDGWFQQRELVIRLQPDAQKGTVFIFFHTARSHDSHLPSKSSSQHLQDDDLFQFCFYK